MPRLPPAPRTVAPAPSSGCPARRIASPFSSTASGGSSSRKRPSCAFRSTAAPTCAFTTIMWRSGQRRALCPRQKAHRLTRDERRAVRCSSTRRHSMGPTIAVETPIAEGHNITRDFKVGGGIVRALRGIDLQLRPGEFVALRGRSGSGKTTLLNILTGIDNPTQGQVSLLGHDLARMNETARAILRREQVGMLFQSAHLFPLLTAQENVEIPLRLAPADPRERAARALAALALVHLRPRAHPRVLEPSGGEQPPVPLARPLAHHA